ncbi:MAG: SRPBCC family protein [Actinomycetales bacterium]|nr:MAG: SRPBCC family protein [Actinomycetales bacterium]
MLSVHRDVEAPPDVVWRLLVDLDVWPRWGPSVRRAELTNGPELRLGSRGRVWTPVGLPLPFEVTAFEPGRHWAWSVAGVPATHHGVEPRGDGTRLSMSAPTWAPAYLPVLATALRRIDRIATT